MTAPPAGDEADAAAALVAAVRGLGRASVLVVGDAMLDRYMFGEVERVSPEAPVPVLLVERELSLPGGAGNVVRNLGALGAAVAFVSIVGDDQSGSDLTGLIGGQPGVEPWLLVQGGRATTTKTRMVAQGQQLLRVDREDTAPVHEKLAERLLRIARDAMAATSVTVFSDYRKGLLAGGLPQALIQAAKAAGRPVVVDLRGADFAAYAGADVIFVPRRELALMSGVAAEDDAAVAGAAVALRQAHGFGAVLVLRAEHGLMLVDAGGVTQLRGEALEVFDPSGAGDTATATLAAALATGCSLDVAARLANLAAGIALARSGTAVVRESDFLAALSPERGPVRKIVGADTAAEQVERWRRRGLRSGFVARRLRPAAGGARAPAATGGAGLRAAGGGGGVGRGGAAAQGRGSAAAIAGGAGGAARRPALGRSRGRARRRGRGHPARGAAAGAARDRRRPGRQRPGDGGADARLGRTGAARRAPRRAGLISPYSARSAARRSAAPAGSSRAARRRAATAANRCNRLRRRAPASGCAGAARMISASPATATISPTCSGSSACGKSSSTAK